MKITFPNLVGNIQIYMDCLRAICGDTEGKSMIDLMSAFAPNTPKLGFTKPSIYVDVIDRKLDHPDQQQYFVKDDVFSFMHEFGEVQELCVDVAICSDGLEHLYPEEGIKFLKQMQLISDKQIIFTPLGEIFKLHTPTADDPEAHHSLWTPDDFPGWATIVFPKYHEQWNGGAFFAFRSENTREEFARVLSLIMKMTWYDHMLAE